MTKTYVAVYEKDATYDAWNVRVDSVPGCRAQGQTLRAAQAGIRRDLRWRLGSDAAEFSVEDRMPSEIAAAAKRADRARREADRAVARARDELVRAARELAALGLSRRDSAALLGISHQRVQQLVRK